MEWRNPAHANNIVRDWNMLQGMTHPSDEHIQIRRDIHSRLVSIENSSVRPVGVAIMSFLSNEVPKIRFIMKPGEIKNIGINTIGDGMQFIYLLDPKTGKPVGGPTAFRTDSQSFVLRDGIQKWYVQAFKKSSFRASH